MKNHYEISGGVTAIYLRHGEGYKVAIIDIDDLPKVMSIAGTWSIKWNPTAKTYYARYMWGGRKHHYTTYMHRFILGVVDPKVHVDHDDHDGLNNRRCNVKATCVRGNGFNRRGAETGSRSGKRNVYWNEREKKWMVWVVCMGKRYYAGYFSDLNEADQAAIKMRLSLGGKA